MFNNYTPFPSYQVPSSYDRINQNMGGQNFNMYPPNVSQTPPTYQQNTNITFVNGIEGAKAYQLSPNSSVLLMDSDNSKFYVKSTDNLGVPKLTSYSFCEENLSQEQSRPPEQPAESTNETKENFDNIFSKLHELEEFRKTVETKLGELL